jgi:hypothetical protein
MTIGSRESSVIDIGRLRMTFRYRWFRLPIANRRLLTSVLLLFVFCFLPATFADIQFEEVSQQAGITRSGESWGNAWADFDGDGYLDLWATNHRHKPSLYRNNGDGTFTDIIDTVWNANPSADTHGAAWADFDNDGDQDLMLLSGSYGGRVKAAADPKSDNHFYLNENGMLIERGSELGVNFPLMRGRTPIWFDFNNDGKLDVMLTGRLRTDIDPPVASILFQQGHAGFVSVSSPNELLFQESVEFANFSDITGDGIMDLIVSGGPYPRGVYDVSVAPFKELESAFNFPKQYSVYDAVYADFNGDLRPDVFLVRGVYNSYVEQIDTDTLRLNIRNNRGEKGISFKAEGDVRFEIYSVWEPRPSLISIGVDGHRLTEFDGEYIGADPVRNAGTFKFTLSAEDPKVLGLEERPEFDLFGIYIGYDPVTERWTLLYHKMSHTNNWTGFDAIVSAEGSISEMERINFSPTELFYNPASVLLINTGNGFRRRITSSGLNEFLGGRSVTAGDFDNDMDLDLYVVRLSSAGNLPNQLYENQGNGTFTQVFDAGGAAASAEGKGHSVTMADYDRDGYLDLFVTNGYGGYPFNDGPDQLFQNVGSGNNWLQIDLEGTVSNRDGIGARLFATTPDGKTQLRENGGGIRWCQQDQKRIHFGLAQNQTVSELVIQWPSGTVQKLENLSVNQVLRVVEPRGQEATSVDVNQDGQVNILDFVSVIKHFGENPPTNRRADVNKDGEVNILDLVSIVRFIEKNQAVAAAPYRNNQRQPVGGNSDFQLLTDVFPRLTISENRLSNADIELLSSFYGRIEEISANATHKELVKRFLTRLLRSVKVPMGTKLHANYPNPFNPETWIPYQLAEDSDITIRIYDAAGHIVRTLFIGHQTAGYYLNRSEAAYWDGKNELGEQVASGVYICELETPTFKQTRRLVVVK